MALPRSRTPRFPEFLIPSSPGTRGGGKKSILIIPLLFALLSFSFACDKPHEELQPSPPPSVRLEITAVTSLTPHRPTLLTINLRGTIYWLRHTPAGGNDVLFVLDSNGIPTATDVTTQHVLAALGAPGGSGSFHSLCVIGDGTLYFYFEGGLGDQILACVG